MFITDRPGLYERNRHIFKFSDQCHYKYSTTVKHGLMVHLVIIMYGILYRLEIRIKLRYRFNIRVSKTTFPQKVYRTRNLVLGYLILRSFVITVNL